MTRPPRPWRKWRRVNPIPGAVLVITALVVIWIALADTF